MPTIKELYDQGQRQFPMRGGGISPMVEWWDCALQYMPIYGGHILCWQENGEFLDSQGNHIDPMDLLPEPLPNQSDKERIATLEAAVMALCDELDLYVDIKGGRISTEALFIHAAHGFTPRSTPITDKYRAIAGGQDNETK